jgi:hypothetical protein
MAAHGSARAGPAPIPAYTLGWPTDGPPWAPFVVTYHSALRRLRKVLPQFGGRRQLDYDIHHVILEVLDPAAGARWLGTVLGLPVHPGDRPVDRAARTAPSPDRATSLITSERPRSGRRKPLPARRRQISREIGCAVHACLPGAWSSDVKPGVVWIAGHS